MYLDYQENCLRVLFLSFAQNIFQRLVRRTLIRFWRGIVCLFQKVTDTYPSIHKKKNQNTGIKWRWLETVYLYHKMHKLATIVSKRNKLVQLFFRCCCVHAALLLTLFTQWKMVLIYLQRKQLFPVCTYPSSTAITADIGQNWTGRYRMAYIFSNIGRYRQASDWPISAYVRPISCLQYL